MGFSVRHGSPTLFARLIFLVFGCTVSIAHAQPAASDSIAIAATVNGSPISVAEVERSVANTIRQLGGAVAAVPALEAQVLNQVIDQRLIEGFLKKAGKAPKPAEVDAEIERLKKKLQQEGSTFEKFLSDRGTTEAELRERLIWNLGWPKYVKEQLTDDALSKYFDTHRRLYDGGMVRASHILLRIEGPRDPSVVDTTLSKAAAIRKEISDGKLTFEAAAEKYSAGPSRFNGGDQGFFPRQGVMIEPFAQAAFALEPGEISQPVLTPFGVHLIKTTDAKPGKETWQAARKQLEADAARDLFTKLGEQERSTAKIEFTGNVPYFKPGTTELVPRKEPATSANTAAPASAKTASPAKTSPPAKAATPAKATTPAKPGK